MINLKTSTTSSETSKLDPSYFYQKDIIRNYDVAAPVIVKISNLEPWEKLNIHTRTIIKTKDGWILTANVPFKKIEKIASLPFVLEIQYSSPIHKAKISKPVEIRPSKKAKQVRTTFTKSKRANSDKIGRERQEIKSIKRKIKSNSSESETAHNKLKRAREVNLYEITSGGIKKQKGLSRSSHF